MRKKYKQGGGIKISENCTGDGIFHCKDIESGYEIANMNTCRNILFSDGGNNSSHCYDCMDVATDETHYLYGVYGQAMGSNLYCSVFI